MILGWGLSNKEGLKAEIYTYTSRFESFIKGKLDINEADLFGDNFRESTLIGKGVNTDRR